MDDTEEYISFAPGLGECVWVWFCESCGKCEGSAPAAGCCRHCGVCSKSCKALVRLEEMFEEE